MSKGESATKVAPYGLWESPITPELLTSKSLSFGEIATLSSGKDATADASHLVFIENRPSEKGRAAAVVVPITASGTIVGSETDLTKGNLNARSGVHEYGGGALAASSVDGSIIFPDYRPGDWGVYRVSDVTRHPIPDPERITPEDGALRYANFAIHPTQPHLIAAVQEDHTVDEPSKVINTLVLINASNKSVTTLHSGYDFYSEPAWSPQGTYIAWISWKHPSMPFWQTEGLVAGFDVAKQSIYGTSVFAGQGEDQVVAAPRWVPDVERDTLLFAYDGTGFANPYQVEVSSQGSLLEVSAPSAIVKGALNADLIKPPWTLGNSSMIFLDKNLLAVSLTRGSSDTLAVLDISTGKLIEVETAYSSLSQLRRISSTEVALQASGPTEEPVVVVLDLSQVINSGSTSLKAQDSRIIKRSSELVSSGQIPKAYLSVPDDIEFPTTLPDGTPSTAHAIVFPPANPEYRAVAGQSPPCIFRIHGGPTSAASKTMSLSTLYWTSRGYSVCFVNYGGSTGYGREYMLRLMDSWGLVDVLDCAAAAKYLSKPRKFPHNQSKERSHVRRMTKTAQRQLASLTETRDPAGSVTVKLRSIKPTWTAGQTVGLPALAGLSGYLASLLPQIPSLTSWLPMQAPGSAVIGFLAGAAAFLAVKSRSVLSESVFASSNFGLQTETVRGLTLPFFSKPILQSRSTTHIPRDRVLDVVLNTAVKGWTIKDYLAVGVRSHPLGSSKNAVPGEKATTRSLEILFPHLEPRLPVCERIYRTIYPALFPPSSNPVGQGANAIPALQHVHSVSRKFESPRANPKALIISGGSAGGFTVLACLTEQPTVFSAGCSSYGVADLLALAQESHKFESQYLFRLLSGSPEEVPQVYHDRSPLYSAHKIVSPVLVLQGSDDKVVPPNQAVGMVDAIRAAAPEGQADWRVKYIEFAGEGHGWRQSQNIVTALKEEEQWYRSRLLSK